jgi:hypothetical protein
MEIKRTRGHYNKPRFDQHEQSLQSVVDQEVEVNLMVKEEETESARILQEEYDFLHDLTKD